MADAGYNPRWRETSILAGATMIAAIVVTLLFLALADPGNGDGFPAGFVLAATGLPFVLAGIVFWAVHRQEAIDRRHGLFED
ncbi:hypothetical protein [Bauldia litoralis]|uniref:hypothetical protein n=1 Tax=Bauldia litoralis TaxID=665467 RepID=UPI0032672647